jgi:hypothetical protein
MDSFPTVTFLVALLLGAIIGAMAVMIVVVMDEQERSLHRPGMQNRNQGLAPGDERKSLDS